MTSDGQRADSRVEAYLGCIALIREAVAVSRAHAAVRGMTDAERAARPDTWRLPELNLADWYRRAGALIDEVDGLTRTPDPSTIDGADVGGPGLLRSGAGDTEPHNFGGTEPPVCEAQASDTRVSNGCQTDRGLIAVSERTIGA